MMPHRTRLARPGVTKKTKGFRQVSNRATLAQLKEMDAAAVNALPLDQIELLQEDNALLKADAKLYDEKICATLIARFGEQATAKLREKKKDTGLVSIPEGDYVVKIDTPKRVDWDQDILRSVQAIIVNEWKEKPEDYLKISLEVSEASYAAWPPVIRKMFEPARTVKPGKIKATLERSKKAAD